MFFRRKFPQWFLLICISCIIVIYLVKYFDYNYQPQISELQTGNLLETTFKSKLSDYSVFDDSTPVSVTVNVNNLQEFQGLQIKNEVYVPFTFLSKYYDVVGKFDSSSRYRWFHVNPAFIDLSQDFSKYSLKGPYLTFHTANVPKRARVKCICGRYEIPITTQWDPKGYYYPTQVAQYGLSYLSRYHIESKKRKLKTLQIPNSGNVIDSTDIPTGLFILKIKFKKNQSSFKVEIVASNGETYTLSYVTDNSMISRKQGVIIHGIGVKSESSTNSKVITRDLNSDILKGLSYQEGQRNGKTVLVNVKSIQQIYFEYPHDLAEVVLLDIDHKAKFLAAANWFVKFQDENGGWKVHVKRVIRKGMEAKPGWYSAMGQGQAISLLTRVYLLTNDQNYLQAALKATQVFHKTSEDNGVKADLFGLPWYEEYPTQPASFVLNGFIYALFGLYDLWKISGDARGSDAGKLFLDGFKTLEMRIPFFDNGYNTFYDLRHVTMPGISPNRARWQYHQVHLEQLHALISIQDSTILSEVLERWTGYVSGILSRHN